MSEIETFKQFLEKIATFPMNPSAAKPRPATASTTIAPPPAPVKAFLITLKPMRGEPKSLKLSTETSVRELRAKAAELFAIDEPERCRLIKTGRALQDDAVTLGKALGLGSAEVTLHMLEKPKDAAAAAPSGSGVGAWKSADAAIWKRIDELLQQEGIKEAAERKTILEKFRAAL